MNIPGIREILQNQQRIGPQLRPVCRQLTQNVVQRPVFPMEIAAIAAAQTAQLLRLPLKKRLNVRQRFRRFRFRHPIRQRANGAKSGRRIRFRLRRLP